MSTQNMIAIKEVCERLDMPEEIIRFSLQESHPDDFDSLKEISLSEFETLAVVNCNHKCPKLQSRQI